MNSRILSTASMLTLLAGCATMPAPPAANQPSPAPTQAAQTQGISGRALDTTPVAQADADWRQAQPVRAPHAMVVSAQHLATQVGVDILKQGGNAVDAAVAVGYALAVVHPCCGNIGGGGFMNIHLASGQNLFLNFRERAPLAATATMFQDAQGNVVKGRSIDTYLGVGTPGTVMGLDTALAKYGTMPLAKVIQPAIDLAEKGFVLTQGDVNILKRRNDDFAKHENVAAIYLNHGKPYEVGDRLVQTQLAATLKLIQQGGTDAFYKGRDRAEGRRGQQGQWRSADNSRFRQLQRFLGKAGRLRISRLHRHFRAAAELGRDDRLRNPADPQALSAWPVGLWFGQGDALSDRGRAQCIRRPQHRPWRPGLHRQSGRATHLTGTRAENPRPDPARPRDPVERDQGRRFRAGRHRNDAFLGHRFPSQRRQRHLHAELPLRDRADGGRHRLLPQ